MNFDLRFILQNVKFFTNYLPSGHRPPGAGPLNARSLTDLGGTLLRKSIVSLFLFSLLGLNVSSSQPKTVTPARNLISAEASATAVSKANGKIIFGYLTFDDTKWTSSSWGEIPVDSLPWDVLTHATLFAASGSVPIPGSYLNQLPYLTQRAHQEGVFAGLCYGGSGDAPLISMLNNSASWPAWIDYNLGLIDNGLDFIEFDLEGSVSGSSARAFFEVFNDSLKTRRSANDRSIPPFIVLTVGPSRAASWADMEPFVGHVNLMSYDYIGDWWGRIIHDFSPTSYQYFNGTGANLDYYSGIASQNRAAPSMQEAALRVRAAGWPLDKIVVGFDVNPTYWSGGTFPDGRGPTYIRQPTSGNTQTAGSRLDFNTQWPTISLIPRDSIHFDRIAKTYWAHTGNSLLDDKLWLFGALPGRDSAMWATRQVVDSMGIGGVMFWNIGSEVWNTSSVPPGGRGWFFSQIRKHFSGMNGPPLPPPPPPERPKIKGQLFFDENQNDLREAGERGMAGWLVTLTGPEELQALTDSAGEVEFKSLTLGDYAVSLQLKSGWTHTTPATISAVSIDTVSDSVAVRFGLYSASAYSFSVNRLWNIVSVPITASSMKANDVFPMGTTPSYAFHDGLYESHDILQNGEGYWMKFGQGHDVWLTGNSRLRDTTDVETGWNFIGSVSAEVPVTELFSVPPGILSPYVYGYGAGSYIAGVIEPGRGYWVSVSEPGQIIISSNSGMAGEAAPSAAVVAGGLNTLTFVSAGGERQTLYFGNGGNGGDEILMLPSPPTPPGDVFSASFGESNGESIVALLPDGSHPGANLRLAVRHARYPMTIEWNMTSGHPQVTLVGDGVRQSLVGSGMIEIPEPIDGPGGEQYLLRLGASGGSSSVPENFALEQNYPNPFNSTTVIRFSLPAESHVRLEIFNLLGERVSGIADLTLPAGDHSIPFVASALASGVYLYRLTADTDGRGQFTETRKLLLLR